MEVILRVITAVLCIAIIIAFFLPWVMVESQQAGSFVKLFTGAEVKGLAAISGFNIPIMANSDDSRLIISIAKIFKPDIQDVDKKSILVVLIPILAVLILVVTSYFGKSRFFNLLIGIVGAVIFAAAMYKIKTTDLEKLILQIRIGSGMWITLYSYLGIGICGFLKVLIK